MKLNNIIFSDPVFNEKQSAWIEHIPFAFFLADVLKPKIFIELGTHYGNSYFAFCQAIKKLDIETKAYAVDTWEGDEHAGFYGNEVFNYVNKINNDNFSHFSNLLKLTFDDALNYFSDNSVDLLHIDGLHTYEAVKHDFENWLPKMSDKGVIILHDTNVHSRGFGVWKLMEEIKKEFSSTEFIHGHGLGVVCVGKRVDKEFHEFVSTLNNETFVKNIFAHLGRKVSLFQQVNSLKTEVNNQRQTLKAKDKLIREKLNKIDKLNNAVTATESLSETYNLLKNKFEVIRVRLEDKKIDSEYLKTHLEEALFNYKAINEELKSINKKFNKVLEVKNRQIEKLIKSNTELIQLSNEKDKLISNLHLKINELNNRVTDSEKKQHNSIFNKQLNKLQNAKHISKIKAEIHYFNNKKLIASSGLFDEDYYLTQNPDVKSSKINPLRHYILHGAYEGRIPSTKFNGNFYLLKYPDVRKAGINPLIHYLLHGKKEGRMAIPPVSKKTMQSPITKNSQPENDHLYEPNVYEVAQRVIDYWNKKGKNNKIVVYTALVGDYDELKIPECLNPEIDYVCFSNYFYGGPNPWKIKYIDYFDEDQTKIARYYKLNPHKLFPDYDIAIWIDATLLIKRGNDFKELIEKHTLSNKIVSVAKHPNRPDVYSEAEACMHLKKDTSGIIEKQINYYKKEGLPRDHILAETMLLISNLNNQKTIKFFNDWWNQILTYSKRDQISLSYVLFNNRVSPNILFDENFNFRFDNKYFKYFLHNNLTNKQVTKIYKYPTFKNEIIKHKIYPLLNLKSDIKLQISTFNKSVDIILPVYNALSDVKKCINSLLPTLSTPKYNLIIINDASNNETAVYLREIARVNDEKITLIENSKNLGYTRSVNKGIKLSKSEYIIVLNSDTIVPKNWINKIIACGESSKYIGVIGPLSNAASWQSIPELKDFNGFKINELPKGVTVDQADKICENFMFIDYPKVPLLNGFCYAIKKEVIEKIGMFDEEAFPIGYGEEDDFSMRVQNAGYSLAIAINTYVYHAKSKSFGNDKRKGLSKKGGMIVKNRYSEKRIKNHCNSMAINPFINLAREYFYFGITKQQIIKDERVIGLVIDYRKIIDDKESLPTSKIDNNTIVLLNENIDNQLNVIPFVFGTIRCFNATINKKLLYLKHGKGVNIVCDNINNTLNDSNINTNSSLINKYSINRKIFKKYLINGKNNKVLIDKDCVLIRPEIKIEGNNNLIILEAALRYLDLRIVLKGNNKVIKIKSSKKNIDNLVIKSLRGNDQKVIIDNDFGCVGVEIMLSDGGETVNIGKDCLFSWDIKLRANDGHSIIDLSTNRAINTPNSIEIGNHCWIGEGVKILKNTKISSNSVVAGFSVVTKRINKENVIIAGIPAKIVKSNINWDRERPEKFNLK